jgi:predicted hotdog family 3-hydroxylacyl-ACP dehydratase
VIADKKDVLRLIPQKGSMVQVSGILDYGNDWITSVHNLSSLNLFCKNGRFTEPGLVENIAQTTALMAGWEADQKGEEVKVGFIGAIKKCHIYNLPNENETLQTTIKVISRFGNATIVKGEVFVNEQIIAEAELSIFTQEEKP